MNHDRHDHGIPIATADPAGTDCELQVMPLEPMPAQAPAPLWVVSACLRELHAAEAREYALAERH